MSYILSLYISEKFSSTNEAEGLHLPHVYSYLPKLVENISIYQDIEFWEGSLSLWAAQT